MAKNGSSKPISSLLKQKKGIIAIIIALILFASCANSNASEQNDNGASSSQAVQAQSVSSGTSTVEDDLGDNEDADQEDEEGEGAGSEKADAVSSSSSDANKSNSNSSTKTKGGVPSVLAGKWTPQSNGLYFTNDADPDFSSSLKRKKASFENYSSLDYLGRCGPALACIGLDIMPTGGRGSISEIKPTGWHAYNYDFVNGGYLYNRCHLIAFSLAGENANERNLITGTRQMNEAMIMFEDIVYTYVTGSGNHCLYRVTPVFLGKELVARGVHMEGYSIEDNGKKVKFNVYIPNKQENVKINYSTGESSVKNGSKSSSSSSKSTNKAASSRSSSSKTGSSASSSGSSKEASSTYVLNTSSKKFHTSNCSAVKKMADRNKSVVKMSRSSIINQGYDACKICNP